MFRVYKFYKKYINDFKLLGSIFIFLSLFITILTLIQPILIGKIIDIITNNEILDRRYYIYRFVIIIMLVYIISTAISFFLNIFAEYLRNKMSFILIEKMIQHLQKCTILNIINKDVSYIINVLNTDCYNMVNFLLQHITNLFVNILSFIIVLSILFSINYKIALIVFAILPLYIIVYNFFKKKLYTASLELRENQSDFMVILYKQLQNIKFLRLNCLFEYLKKDLESKFKIVFNSSIEYSKQHFLFSSVGDIISNLVSIILIVIGGLEIISGNLSIGMFTIINSYIAKLISNISYFVGFSSDYQSLLVSFYRLDKIVSIKPDPIGEICIDNINNIEINNISFSYNKKNLTIDNMSLVFNANNIYIIKGCNGCGKSTLINIILGLLGDYTGNIIYNGFNLKLININYLLKKCISIVDQEPVILSDTVINNITFGDESYELDMIKKYISKFNLNNIYDNFKDNIIDSNTISGGEKQKISLIRALIKNPSVLILDEPTSALDKESITYLKELLIQLKKEKIIIIITHDSTLNDIADNIIELDKIL